MQIPTSRASTRQILPILLVAACSSRVDTVSTWQDAWNDYAESWCDQTSRCTPDYFRSHYQGHDDCVAVKLDELCRRTSLGCDAPYPKERDTSLHQCVRELEELYCGAFLPPDSCFEAFSTY